MSRWFRHYAGLCRDEKLVSVAIKAKQPIERVVWVWCAILESAAEVDDNGRYSVDAAEIAYFLRADEADICAIENALRDAARVASGCVVAWSKRQFSSDRSKERVAAYRERKRANDVQSDDIQTSQNGAVDEWAFFEPSNGGADFRRSLEWRDVRSRIFKRDDFTCAYCGVRGERMECDHVIPVSRGGSHDDQNLTTACKPCNQSKRAKLLSEWLI